MTIWDTIQEIDFDHEDFESHFSAKQKEGGEGDNDKLNAALAGKVRHHPVICPVIYASSTLLMSM
jgi:hypothetical protein